MQYKICMLIENPADASFLEDEYISSALLAISLETGEYVPSATEHKYYKLNYPDKEYNVDNFEILADEEKILSFLKENGIDGVKKYYVLILPTVIDGFLLYVQISVLYHSCGTANNSGNSATAGYTRLKNFRT